MLHMDQKGWNILGFRVLECSHNLNKFRSSSSAHIVITS